MPQDEALTRSRLQTLWDNPTITVLPLLDNSYFLLSDVHLGDKTRADDFRKNETTLQTALNHYNNNGFSLVLLGDIEELWQFDLKEVIPNYNDSVYKAIKMYGDNRVYRVFGNHDDLWCPPSDPIRNSPNRFGSAYEAVKFVLQTDDKEFYVLAVHGHQGSLESDKYSSLSRKPVRIYRYIEGSWNGFMKLIGLYCPSRPETDVKKNYEAIMYRWAKDNNLLLICGHSHRAIFGSLSYAERLQRRLSDLNARKSVLSHDEKVERKRILSEVRKLEKAFKREKRRDMIIIPVEEDVDPVPCYFNTGCALYENGITGIELTDGMIRLVKWWSDSDNTVKKTVYESGDLVKILSKCCSSMK